MQISIATGIVTQPTVVLLYVRLYAARRGFVSHPHPRGVLNPSE